MKTVLEEIRKQSGAIRLIMFCLCVITAVSVVGVIWFNSFQKNLVALSNNPTTVAQDQTYHQDNKPEAAFFGDVIGKLRGAVYDVLGISSNKKSDQINTNSGPAYLLPLSGQR